jgi:hypothetical protein
MEDCGHDRRGRVDEWPEARRGGVDEIKVLVSELNQWLAK